MMAKKKPQPGAEEINEPQNTLPDQNTESTQTEENTAVNEDSSTPNKTSDEIEVDPSSEDSSSSSSEENESIDYSDLSLDDIVSIYAKLTDDQHWRKNQKEIQQAQLAFDEKFQIDVETKKKAFLDEGGNEIDFLYKPEFKSHFDQLSYEFRKKRRQFYKEQEATQKVNLERRKAIIEEIKGLIEVDQNINATYKTFKTLQESWYNTGHAPRALSNNLWETYKHHVERFYDFLHLNRELRELDFKHNYEEKLKIIKKAEVLAEEEDIIKASRDLNTLHQLWKNDLGPVAKEHREELWKRFQDASKTIQKKRQDLQKEIAGTLRENSEKKEELLKAMHALNSEIPKNHKEWQKAIKSFNSLRDEFKKVGYIPTKESKSSWQEFREVSRTFMRQKNDFYKNQKEEYSKNIEAKKDLIDQSQAVLDSEDWSSLTQQMIEYQKGWKRIGFVPRKLDNKLWKTFSNIHELYFNRLKTGYQKLSDTQMSVQKEKRKAIEEVHNLDLPVDTESLLAKCKTLWTDWNTKENIGNNIDQELNQSYIAALIEKVKSLKLDKKALDSVLVQLNKLALQEDPKRFQKEMQIVKTNLNTLKAELTQLQNNLEFFSDSSTENPLYKNVEKQIEKCQKKIDQTQAEYIQLKQLKNEMLKQEEQEQQA